MRKYLFFLVLLSLLAGCKKFSKDEKIIHLLSVKQRLSSVCWNSDQNPNNDNCMSFYRDGSFEGVNPLGFTGTWELIDHNNKIHFTNSSNNATYDFKIIRLEHQDDGRPVLWLENDTAIFYFISHKD
jgi:hypothetical protein